tara:strand:+ start:264 stop:497 length:234 start_codon:yes stop_codon:yes gene_type:complete
MKEVNIKVKNISVKQWPLLLIELNLIAKSWKRFGPRLNIRAKDFDRIVKWGKKKHGEDISDFDTSVRRKYSKRTNKL